MQCLPSDHRLRKSERENEREGSGVVITFSSHLHDRSSCLIKALMHNTSAERGDNERRVQRGKTTSITDNGAFQQANELVKC